MGLYSVFVFVCVCCFVMCSVLLCCYVGDGLVYIYCVFVVLCHIVVLVLSYVACVNVSVIMFVRMCVSCCLCVCMCYAASYVMLNGHLFGHDVSVVLLLSDRRAEVVLVLLLFVC